MVSAPTKFITAVEWNWKISEQAASVQDLTTSMTFSSSMNLCTARICKDDK